MTPGLRFAARSDVGRVRKDNQDSGYAGPFLLAVADGVGGAARGDLASATAINQARRLDEPPDNDMLGQLEHSLLRMHDRLAELVAENPAVEGTSTTFTGALFDGERLGIAHVGDSRGYLLRDGQLRQLTIDHTFVQSLVDEGRITAEEARTHPHRNMILKAVDSVHDPEPDSFQVDVQPGDRILLCSDGCCGSLTDDQMAELMVGEDLDAAAIALVNAALDAGSSDNVTVVLAEVVADLEQAAEPIVVGAAATDPRSDVRGGGSWKLLRRDKPVEEPVDPETMRYAPRQPGRFGWLRRLTVFGVVAVLAWLAGSWAYSWTQTQYYVGANGDKVSVFRGVEADLPGVKLHTLYEQSDIALESLPEHTARDVRNGRPAGSLERAREIVTNLRVTACGRASTPVVTRTVKPTAKPARPRTKKSATPKPALTTITPGTAPTGSCEPAP